MTLEQYLLEAYPDMHWKDRQQAFADKLGGIVAPITIRRYQKFLRFPSREMIERICDATEGLVTANDFMPPRCPARSKECA